MQPKSDQLRGPIMPPPSTITHLWFHNSLPNLKVPTPTVRLSRAAHWMPVTHPRPSNPRRLWGWCWQQEDKGDQCTKGFQDHTRKQRHYKQTGCVLRRYDAMCIPGGPNLWLNKIILNYLSSLSSFILPVPLLQQVFYWAHTKWQALFWVLKI